MVLAANVPVNSYVGDGSANTFAFTFPVFEDDQILVTVINTVTGVTETLVLATDFSVTGLNVSGGPASTGSIVLINAAQSWLSGGNLATDWTLSIVGNCQLAQTFSFRNQGDFYRTSLENSLDYQMMCIQQLQAGGYILIDIVTGDYYRLFMVNGVLSQVQITP